MIANQALKKAFDNYKQSIESGDLVVDYNNNKLIEVLKITSKFTQAQIDEINTAKEDEIE